MHKACHSPYFQNGLQKSALGILRFTFSVAFSHKELMGHFEVYLGLYCQNDEVSTDGTRRGRDRYPHGPREPARFCGPLLICPWRGILAVFSTTLFLTVLQGIMTETVI